MYRIIKFTKYWFLISGLLMILSVLSILIYGLNLGIDYKGGTVIEFQSDSFDAKNVTENTLKKMSIDSFQIKESTDEKIIIRLPVLSNDQHLQFSNFQKEQLSNYNETAYDTVGPSISKDLTNKSILAVILAVIGIIIYIAIAFRKIPKPLSAWIFGVSAVVALIHDLLITVGLVSIVGHFVSWMEVDALFTTAMLTIMGFSVHDTIVVYDRLRENFIQNPHQELELTAEESVNQTLARSINTSLTVILVLLALLLIGAQSIRHFVSILAFGILIGTYSSIFVASPLMVSWHKLRIKQARHE